MREFHENRCARAKRDNRKMKEKAMVNGKKMPRKKLRKWKRKEERKTHWPKYVLKAYGSSR